MTPNDLFPSLPAFVPPSAVAGRLRVGMDIVQISRVRESLDDFGDRFTARLFTAAEIGYATAASGLEAERFAARFAAKEAAIKAFGLSESGLDWRDIEVLKFDDGSCRLRFHRQAAAWIGSVGVDDVSLSLSHDGDYATAVVAALLPSSTPPAIQ